MVAGLLYLVYNYAIFAFSVAMNPLTPLHIAIFGLSPWSLVLGPVVPANPLAATCPHRRRLLGDAPPPPPEYLGPRAPRAQRRTGVGGVDVSLDGPAPPSPQKEALRLASLVRCPVHATPAPA